MSDNEELGGTEPRTISRRTVAKAAAWAVPVVAMATAAPAYAASCVPVPVVAPGSCKQADAKNYTLFFAIGGTGCTNSSCTGTITKIYQSTGQGLTYWTGSSPADGTTPIYICGADNMANYIMVTATIMCGTSSVTNNYQVAMPNFNSNNNQCATPPSCPA